MKKTLSREKIQHILDEVKTELSINGVFISNLLTYGLIAKNAKNHKKLVRDFNSGILLNGIETPYKYLQKIVAEHPEILKKDALVQYRTLSYEELIEESNALSNYLHYNLQLQKGENVSVCSASTIEGIIGFLSLNNLGLVNARIFNGSKSEKMLDNLISFDSSTIITDGFNIDTLSSVVGKTKIKNVIVYPNCSELAIERFKMNNPSIKIIRWEDAVAKGKETKEVYHEDVKSEDVAAILYTSGSSGDPKPITIQNRVYSNMVDVVCGTTGIKKCDDEKALGVVSQEYPYSAINSTMMIILMGKTLILPPIKRSNEIDFDELLAKEIDNIQAIPNFYKLLEVTEEKGLLKIKDLSAVKKVVSGGEKYHTSEKKRLLNLLRTLKCHPILIDGFGFGELGSAAALKFGLCKYFLLMNGIEAKAVDPNTLEDLGEDQEGLMMFTGPTIAAGYYKREESTQKSFVKDENGKLWFVSDTYGSVHGKKRRLFKLGARIREYFITADSQGSFVKVYSGNVEDVILSTGMVEDCVVVQSDSGATPKPVAYVSLRTDIGKSKDEITEIILRQCQSLEEFARPVEINFESQIARTPNADKKDYVYYKKKRNIN